MFEDNDQASKKSLSRRDVIRLGGASAALPLLGNVAALCQVSASGQAAEWRQYAGDKASTKYSALDQINAENFNNMKQLMYSESRCTGEHDLAFGC